MWPISLPTDFTFRFYGTNYAHMRIGPNGGIIATNTVTAYNNWDYADFLTPYNESIPYNSSWSANRFIAPWWTDFGYEPSLAPHPGGLSYVVEGTAPNRVIKVQWKNLVNYYCNSYSTTPCNQLRAFSFQAWIYEASATGTDNSLIFFSYATPIGPDGTPHGGAMNPYSGTYYNMTASVGIEDAAGTTGVAVMSCTPNCNETQFPANQMYILGSISGAELLPTVTVPSYASTPTDLQVDANTTVFNLGSVAASNIGWDLYLSTDSNLDASDTPLTSVAPTLSASGGANVSQVASAIIPRPADGFYYVCADVDPSNVVAERLEGNNKNCTPGPILVGTELTGAVNPPAVGSPGEAVGIPITIRNRGSDPTATFTYRIYFSVNDTYELGDQLLHSGTRQLGGSEVFNSVEQVFVPPLISGNQYHVILVIDADDTVAEIDETNNVHISDDQITLIKPEIKPNFFTMDAGFGCYFGQPMDVSYEVCNDGAGNAWNFVNSVVMSENYVVTSADPELDASPAACGQDSDCPDLAGGGAGFCYLGTCHNPCASDAECTGGLVCAQDRNLPLMWSCQNHIAPGECKTFSRTITVPRTDRGGETLPEGEYYFGVIADSADNVNEENEGNQIRKADRPYLCREPSMDIAPITAIPPARLSAGEVSPIYRVIRNVGNVESEFTYRYFLSTNEHITLEDIPLDVEATGGPGTGALPAFTESQSTDLVYLPDHVAPGEYYLGIIVDPQQELNELDRSNNVFVTSTRVQVMAAAFRVVSGALPDATVGAYYRAQLVAAGADGDVVWSVTEGNLPPGLSLSSDGVIDGTPIDVTTGVFTVRASSGSVVASKPYALRVLPPLGALAITTGSVPPAVVGKFYSEIISVEGGMPPYQDMKLVSPSRLPAGLAIVGNRIEGSPLETTSEPMEAILEARDHLGNVATRTLPVVVVDAADLFIDNQRFPEATAGEEYLDGCIKATGGDGVYTWTIDPATIPAGLTQQNFSTQTCLVGTPLDCDSFNVSVRVQDGQGQSDTAELPLTVICGRVGLATKELAPVEPGETIEVQLEAKAGAGVTFRYYGGRLPVGVTLSESGLLSGTVAEDTVAGAFNFIVEVKDEEGGYGLDGLTLQVVPEPIELEEVKPEPKGGCSTSDGGSGAAPLAAALVALAAWGRGIRRRV
ncbi:CARDB domain-containing protein [Vulgatibacter sp.]|uniref:CARDB domain-containing protein n=1 Tax=Vulgatibacter sp. TaxID=1971226 RepID=UPI00356741D4